MSIDSSAKSSIDGSNRSSGGGTIGGGGERTHASTDNIIVSEWQGRRIQMLTPMGAPLLVLPVPNADSLAGVCLVGDALHCAVRGQ